MAKLITLANLQEFKAQYDAHMAEYVQEEISKAVFSSGYVYKGSASVSDINNLQAASLTAGDVYNVTDSGTVTPGNVVVSTGDNIAWTGSAWNKLAGVVDLSGYAQTSWVTTNFVPYTGATSNVVLSSGGTYRDLTAANIILPDDTGKFKIEGNTSSLMEMYLDSQSGDIKFHMVDYQGQADSVVTLPNTGNNNTIATREWVNTEFIDSTELGTALSSYVPRAGGSSADMTGPLYLKSGDNVGTDGIYTVGDMYISARAKMTVNVSAGNDPASLLVYLEGKPSGNGQIVLSNGTKSNPSFGHKNIIFGSTPLTEVNLTLPNESGTFIVGEFATNNEIDALFA